MLFIICKGKSWGTRVVALRWGFPPLAPLLWGNLHDHLNPVKDKISVFLSPSVINVLDFCGYISATACLGLANILDGFDLEGANLGISNGGLVVKVLIPNSFTCKVRCEMDGVLREEPKLSVLCWALYLHRLNYNRIHRDCK